jgi:hypothetical protein
MTLWWLVFRGGGAVIVEGESITHARLLAVVNELCRASQFLEGYPIDHGLIEMIPEDFKWRRLSRQQAGHMLAVMKDDRQKRVTSTQAQQSQAEPFIGPDNAAESISTRLNSAGHPAHDLSGATSA